MSADVLVALGWFLLALGLALLLVGLWRRWSP
jgi:hypothetical protein